MKARHYIKTFGTERELMEYSDCIWGTGELISCYVDPRCPEKIKAVFRETCPNREYMYDYVTDTTVHDTTQVWTTRLDMEKS